MPKSKNLHFRQFLAGNFKYFEKMHENFSGIPKVIFAKNNFYGTFQIFSNSVCLRGHFLANNLGVDEDERRRRFGILN